MAITYELLIQNIQTSPSEGDFQDVVKIIYWMYSGKETITNKDFYGDAEGAVEINSLNTGSFTSFSNLTENQVKSWVEPKLDLVKIKADIASRIEAQKNLIIESKSNPWSNEDI
jgi:hypothetical protein